MIVKNVSRIKELGKMKESENLKFQSYLKLRSFENLNLLIQSVYHQISSEIDCKICANCCKELLVTLDEEEIKNFSYGIGISEDEFKKRFLVKGIGKEYTFNRLPCPFLRDNLCQYYSYRPKLCRSFPHLGEEDFIFKLKSVLNCTVCPILYNFFEVMKFLTGFYEEQTIGRR